MAIFRVEKNNNYTAMSNYHLRDKEISLKAKGLLSFMLSLPDDWDYSLNGLESVLADGETAIKSTLKELERSGYLKIEKFRNKKGQFEYVYNIFEEPIKEDSIVDKKEEPEGENPPIENPGVEVPGVEVPEVENQTQINTNNKVLNNKILNNKKKKNKKEKETEIDKMIKDKTVD